MVELKSITSKNDNNLDNKSLALSSQNADKEIAEAQKGSQVIYGLTSEGYKFTVTQTGLSLSDNPNPIPTSGLAINYNVHDSEERETVTIFSKDPRTGTLAVSNIPTENVSKDIQEALRD